MIARLALGLAMILATLAGCATDPTAGYSTQSAFRDDVTSVSVRMFENATFQRDLEFELTDAVIKELQSRTPYRIDSSARADTVLLGRITEARLRQLSKSRVSGLSEEVVISVTIDFEWKDLRTDTTLVERRAFSGQGLFVPSNPERESLELGRYAAVQQLARDIVFEMRSVW